MSTQKRSMLLTGRGSAFVPLFPPLAHALGDKPALALARLHFLAQDADDHVVRRTYEDWRRDFPDWSIKSVQRTFDDLSRPGTARDADGREFTRDALVARWKPRDQDRTNCYRPEYEAILQLCDRIPIPRGQIGFLDLVESSSCNESGGPLASSRNDPLSIEKEKNYKKNSTHSARASAHTEDSNAPPDVEVLSGEVVPDDPDAAVTQRVLEILSTCPRIRIGDETADQVDRARAQYPEHDACRAAETAVIWASDPEWRTTRAGALFQLALKKERPDSGGKRRRNALADMLAELNGRAPAASPSDRGVANAAAYRAGDVECPECKRQHYANDPQRRYSREVRCDPCYEEWETLHFDADDAASLAPNGNGTGAPSAAYVEGGPA